MNICVPIFVSSMEKSLEFYIKVFQLHVVSDVTIGSGQRFVRLGFQPTSSSQTLLELIEPASDAEKRFLLLSTVKRAQAVQMNVDDFDDTLSRLFSLDILPQKTDFGHAHQSAEFTDPDGRVIIVQHVNVEGLGA